MFKIREDVRENIENMKVFFQRRILHLTKTKDEWLRCAGKEAFDQMSCWHPRKKIGEKEFWRHDRREKNETLTTGRVGESLRRVGEKFYISEARVFFVPRILEKEDNRGDGRGSRCSSQIAESGKWKYLSDGWDYESHRTKIETRSLSKRKNREEQSEIWLGPSKW